LSHISSSCSLSALYLPLVSIVEKPSTTLKVSTAAFLHSPVKIIQAAFILTKLTNPSSILGVVGSGVIALVAIFSVYVLSKSTSFCTN